MAYCALADILKMVPEAHVINLTDDEDTGAVVQARVDEAIAQADAEIDSYVGARYSVPLVTGLELARKLSVDIAIYNLYSRTVQEIPEARGKRYDDAIRTLKDISKGVVSLGVEPAPDSVTLPDGAETNKTEDTAQFTRDNLTGF